MQFHLYHSCFPSCFQSAVIAEVESRTAARMMISCFIVSLIVIWMTSVFYKAPNSVSITQNLHSTLYKPHETWLFDSGLGHQFITRFNCCKFMQHAPELCVKTAPYIKVVRQKPNCSCCHCWNPSIASGLESVHPSGHIIRISWHRGVVIRW